MGRRQAELNSAAKQIGAHVIPVQGDVSVLSDVEHLFEAVKPHGPIDIVFANAGFTEAGLLSD